MADTTRTAPEREPFVDRFRMINPRWLQWIKPLLDTVRTTARQVTTVSTEVNGLTSTVTQVQESVDGYAGRWSISYDINGKVLGSIKLDGSAEYTTIDVLADRFSISHPTSTEVVITPFVVGLVNGVSTVGIQGELLVDGSIRANSLDVDDLSAINANMGTITAGVLQSAGGNFVIDLDNETIDIIAPP